MNRKWLRVIFFVVFVIVILLGSALARLFFSEIPVRSPMGAEGTRLRFYILGGSILLVLIMYVIQRHIHRQREG
jgi:uncharacterized membrane protein